MKHDAGFGVLTGNNIETRLFKAGTTIFREGEQAHELFVIAGEPYAVWFAGGLQIAHLCP